MPDQPTASIPLERVVKEAIHVATMSPCRSKRGVVIWDPTCTSPGGPIRGHGYNAPPVLRSCPGREICAGTCGQRVVHAEVRAIREAELARVRNQYTDGFYELLHVELASGLDVRPDGPMRVDHGPLGVTWSQSARIALPGVMLACDGPSCGPCASLIAEVGFIDGVWLFETSGSGWAAWRRYTAEQFYEATMARVRPAVPGSFSIGCRRE